VPGIRVAGHGLPGNVFYDAFDSFSATSGGGGYLIAESARYDMSDSIAFEWQRAPLRLITIRRYRKRSVLMMLPEADELLTPAMAIDGFRLGCLVDASTGMILATLENSNALSPSTAAAGAADVVNVLTLLTGKLATGEILEDVMITFSDSFFMVHPVGRDPEPRILLLVVADRHRTNLALAHRSLRDICASIPS
jgi:hypothetical protein